MRLPALTTAGALCAATLIMLAPGGAQAVPGGPSSEFDPATVATTSFVDQSVPAWNATFAAMSGGYIPTDLEINTDDGYRVSSIWQANPAHRKWRLKRNLDAAAYGDYWDKAKRDGYRLVEHETYVRQGERQYAGIWIKNDERFAWASKRGQTYKQLRDTMTTYRSAGLMPIDVDTFRSNGTTRYSTVWVAKQTSDWSFARDLTRPQWLATLRARQATQRLVTMDAIQAGSQMRFSGIFVTNDNGRAWTQEWLINKPQNNILRNRDLGMRLVALGRYAINGKPTYWGTWRQNSDRPDWTFRQQVDAAVTQGLDNSTYNGVSVAVSDHGNLIYARGFGKADQDKNVWMDSQHIGQIASISKAVAGVLAFDMLERGQLPPKGLETKTRDLVPAMPAAHTHSLAQLLTNRGCVRYYPDKDHSYTTDNTFEDKPFGTALAAAQKFWSDPLECDPATTAKYWYTTHGYTILGAALEKAGNASVKALVASLTARERLGTLGIQRTTGHRMTLYNRNGKEIADPNNDWKVLGGGLESTTPDLAQFGWRLLNHEILTDASRDQMWTAPDSLASYAYGWELDNLPSGQPTVGKGGSNDGVNTALLMARHAGLSVAVIYNGGKRDENPTTALARGLAEEILEIITPLPS